MSGIKSLVKDTAIYGLSTVVGKFLSWLLTFVYVQVLLPEEFGRMTNLYAWTALLMIVLTYGMETSFFRFVSRHERPGLVYSTALSSLGITSSLFITLGALFLTDISAMLDQSGHEALVLMLIMIIALDAFCAIPLGYLRYAQMPWRFMFVRMGFILLTITLTLLTFFVVPDLSATMPSLFGWYDSADALYYIFGINLIGSVMQLLILVPAMRVRREFSWSLLTQMLSYAWPILLLGLAGSFNNQADKILFPLLFDDRTEGDAQLGIYSACYKLAVIMVLFTQAFRYAYDPYVFARSKEGETSAKAAYASAMKYYLLFTLVIFVGVMASLDLLKMLIAPAYHAGLAVVAPVMAGQLMFGIYFNLSLWYKLTDRTYWGAILSLVSCLVTVLVIVAGAERYGFMACAWASVLSNALIMFVSYVLGQRYYPIRYPLGAMGLYTLLAGGAVALVHIIPTNVDNLWIKLALGGITTLAFIAVIVTREVPRTAFVQFRKRIGL